MEGETLIYEKDARWYNFISKYKVKFSDINLNEVAENAILFNNHLQH